MDALALIERIEARRRREARQALMTKNRAIARGLRDNAGPFEVTEEIFRGKYRLSKELAQQLIRELEPVMPPTQRRHALSLETKVLCALRFYANGSYQKITGSDANFGLSQASVSRVVAQVTAALTSPQILLRHIKFPGTRQERRNTIQRNYETFNIPGVLGFVDGSHIAIREPYHHENIYMNRKGFYSINMQIVCDSDLQIFNALANFPGSTHDSFIWRACTVRTHMEDLHNRNEQCWLLGDSGYPLQPWLLTPIGDAAPDTPEAQYNKAHMRARNAVERCIGLLKARFRCLLKKRVLEYNALKAGCIAMACVVLHNMCNAARIPPPEEGIGEEEIPELDYDPVQNLEERRVLAEGRRVQAALVQRLL